MRELSHNHRPRVRLFALAAALCALAGLLAGATTARGSAFSFEVPTLQVTVSPTSATTDQDVTLTAVVTATTAYPDGTITFATLDDQRDPIGGHALPLQRVSDLQSKATLTTTFSANTYAIVAFFTPTPEETANFTFFPADTTATPVALQVSAAAPTPVPTHTTLEVSPLPVVQGQHESLTAHVTADSGPTPTGGQVYFYDGTGRIGQATLANGVATVADVGSFGPGPHELSATYDGNAPLWSGSSTGAGTSFTVADLNPPATTTHTTLAVTPSTIHTSESVDLVAHITQAGGALAPPGDLVFFYASGDCLNGSLGSAPVDADGNATLPNVGSWSIADYTLCASYVGNTFENISGSSGTAPLHVVAPSSPTTLTLSGPASADYGTHTTFAVHLADGAGAVAGKTVTIRFGAQSCSPATDVSGRAQCTFTANDPSVSTVTASFAGDAVDDPSSASQGFAVTLTNTIGTTLRYTGAATGDYGDDVTLAALLLDPAQEGLAGKTVTLTLGTQSCDATTIADGTASCSVTIAQSPGPLEASAHFAGDDPYLASDAAPVPFTVTKEEATLTLSAPTSVVSGDTVTLTGTLREDGSTAIAGRSLTFTFGSATCAATTGADGTATCTSTAAGSGPTDARVAFAGDDEYTAPADATARVVVQLHTALTYTGPRTGDFDDAVTVSAHLADQTGAAVDGAMVTFTLGAQSCTGTTVSGDASCTLTPGQAAVATTLHVSYAGDGSVLLPSSAAPAFTVAREETTLTLNAPAAAQQGSTITLSAKMLEDGTTPIDGRSVTFAYGDLTCTGTTSGGVATCQVPASSLGPLTVTASFAADDYYAAAASSTTTLYVYAPTPGGGMFVVGDLSAAGSVTFWDSQWWKTNTLSGGFAPPAFKGYALHASTTCGGTWSTDPGNSTPPPAGPLPAYIAVVVASSAAKSGAAISGSEVHVVVVKTSPGYVGSPGHAGTGAVVASIC